jgi:hypothetical protein
MKSKVRLQSHSVATGENVIEIWHEGTFLATIAGSVGPAVRIVTKHKMTAKPAPEDGSGIHVLEVKISKASKKNRDRVLRSSHDSDYGPYQESSGGEKKQPKVQHWKDKKQIPTKRFIPWFFSGQTQFQRFAKICLFVSIYAHFRLS